MYNEPFSSLLYYLPKKGTILDAGCGPGIYAKKLKKINDNIICLDLANFFNNDEDGISFCLGSISNIPIKSNSIDFIYCLTVIQYIENDAQAINEFYRILKPKGKLLITVPTKRSPFWLIREMEIYFGVYPMQPSWNIRPYKYYTRNIINNLAENKFNIVEIRGYMYNFFPRLCFFFFNFAKKNRYIEDFFSKFVPSIKHNAKTQYPPNPLDHIRNDDKKIKNPKRHISKISDISYHYLIVLEKC